MKRKKFKRKFTKNLNFKIAQLKFFAGLLTNLAAGWVGIVVITPGFIGDYWSLTKNLLYATICSLTAVKLEEKLLKYE